MTLSCPKAEDFRRLKHAFNPNVSVIGMFDVGQLPYNIEADQVLEPSLEEKRALGQLIGKIFNAAANGEPVVETLIDSVSKDDWGSAKEYLVNEQRSLLARMDVHKGFSINDENPENSINEKKRAEVLTSIFRAVWKTGQIDPELFKGITDTLGLKACFNLLKSSALGQDNVIDIQITDNSLHTGNTRISALEMMRSIAGSSCHRTFNHLVSFLSVANDNQGLAKVAEQSNIQSTRGRRR